MIKITFGNKDSDLVGKVFLLDNHGKVLLLKRPDNIPFGGLWDLPGGHIHKKEPIKEGTVREVKEETNLSIATKNLMPVANRGNIHFFWTTKWTGNFEISWEHEEFEWVNANDITSYDAGKKFNEVFKIFQNVKGVM
jgi:8-oxo-dGTP diphosphatase